MSPERFPIVDPETGEVLALDDEDADALRDYLGGQLVEIECAAAKRPDLVRMLALVLERERPWVGPDGYAVALKPARTRPGRVLADQIEAHREALTPLGLGPRERTVVVVDVPKVSELTTAAARSALARAGLSPEALIYRPPLGPDEVVVIAPAPAPAPAEVPR